MRHTGMYVVELGVGIVIALVENVSNWSALIFCT